MIPLIVVVGSRETFYPCDRATVALAVLIAEQQAAIDQRREDERRLLTLISELPPKMPTFVECAVPSDPKQKIPFYRGLKKYRGRKRWD